MVSDAFRVLEDHANETRTLQDDLIEAIAHKLDQPKAVIERIVYLTCVTSASRPFEVAHIINEFHMHVHDEAVQAQAQEHAE